MLVRKPAVSGSFYPSDPSELRRLIRDCYESPLGPGRPPPAVAGDNGVAIAVAPHAGFQFSGPVAAHSFLHASSLRSPDLLVVVGPNHYGIGAGVSTFKEGEWETPLGRLTVDAAAARAFIDLAETASFDPGAHRVEHSIEVELPFLQDIFGDTVPFLPISMLFQDAGTAESVARAVLGLVKERKAVVIASSDLSHYESAQSAGRKDRLLIERVLEGDIPGFYRTLDRLEVTACGFGPIAVAMGVAAGLGLRGELMKYATSGDVTGDNVQVVGYSALRFV